MYTFIYFAVLLIASCYAKDQSNEKNSVCKNRNAYIPVDGSCDTYTECRDFAPTDRNCPEGLHFDPKAQWPVYPCGYPHDVPCNERSVSQPADPTDECPHQYGFFPSPLATSKDCGRYRMCVAGRAMEMYCPAGLAFNPTEGHCDWPENVPTCNSGDFLGYACPPGTKNEDGSSVVTNHKYEGDCYSFYSCMDGKARMLSCDPGFAFDADAGRCENSENVVCKSPNTE